MPCAAVYWFACCCTSPTGRGRCRRVLRRVTRSARGGGWGRPPCMPSFWGGSCSCYLAARAHARAATLARQHPFPMITAMATTYAGSRQAGKSPRWPIHMDAAGAVPRSCGWPSAGMNGWMTTLEHFSLRVGPGALPAVCAYVCMYVRVCIPQAVLPAPQQLARKGGAHSSVYIVRTVGRQCSAFVASVVPFMPRCCRLDSRIAPATRVIVPPPLRQPCSSSCTQRLLLRETLSSILY